MDSHALWLSNAPSTFMRLMNRVLQKSIGHFIVYFDDILVYSRSFDEHIEHLTKVFEVLREEKLFANLKKCTFCKDYLVFLGYVISQNRVEVDVEKVKTIKEWRILTNVAEVCTFHGLVSFYRHFVKNFSSIVAPLTECIKKEIEFKWTDVA